jgi:hypothetical protein
VQAAADSVASGTPRAWLWVVQRLLLPSRPPPPLLLLLL